MIKTFFTILFTAVALENAVFSRALGLNRWTAKQDSIKNILWYGGLFTWICFFSTVFGFFMLRWVNKLTFARFVRAPGFLVCTLVVYLITYQLIRKFLPKQASFLIDILPLTTFNTALFSVFFVVINRVQGELFGFNRTVVYALGTGIGYTLALIILMYAKKRLALCPVPKSFRGAPINLLYMGLLSLALYGLLGYGGIA